MSLFHFEKNKVYRYGIWKIEEDETFLRDFINKEVDTPFTNAGRRIEFLAVRALAKTMNVDPQMIAYFPSGKPYIKGSTLNISISHTKGYTAILLSSQKNIGIDIEQKSERIIKIRDKFMHPEEEKQLFGQEGKESTLLLLHWCAKESLFKAIIDEEVDFLRELRILHFTAPTEKGSFKAKALRSGINFQVDYQIEKDFVLTCCFAEESR
jgi:phosphopantetheinyl transferase